MGSKIEWTNKTWNPTTGCTYYSSAKNGGNECLNCYSETLTKRLKAMGEERYKEGFDVFVEHEDVLNEPYSWKQPSTVFVNSMSDLLHKDCSDDFIEKVFKVINNTQQHIYQILTKRHERFEKLPDNLIWSDNIWMGVSCGTQYATRRIPALVGANAKHKFLSIEPLIQEITDMDLTGINWVIVGGESGNNTYKIEKDENGEEKFELDDNGKKILEKKIRPMKKEWVETIKNKCDEKGIPFFFKQWGKSKNNPDPNDPTLNKEHRYYAKGGCQLNGKIYWANPTMKDDSIPMINVFGEDYYVMDEYEELNTIWELKSYLPMMDKQLYSQLKENIKQNDLNDPILYYVTSEGKKLVIEGHTRLKACIELKKKEIPTKEIKETFDSLDEIKLWMTKNQLGRRNLSNLERVRLAFLSKPLIEKLAKANLSIAGKSSSNKTNTNINTKKIVPVDTYSEIAKIANVSRTTVVKYSRILTDGSETIKNQLNKGDITIGNAHKLLKITNEEIVENTNEKFTSILPDKKINLVTPDSSVNNPISTKLDHADSLRNKNKIVEENINEEIVSKEVKPIQYNIIILQNISEGEEKLLNGEIDVIMIFKQNDDLGILKNNPDFRIGAYYLA